MLYTLTIDRDADRIIYTVLAWEPGNSHRATKISSTEITAQTINPRLMQDMVGTPHQIGWVWVEAYAYQQRLIFDRARSFRSC